MRRVALIVVGAALALLPLAVEAADVTAKDVKGSKVHLLFTRMQGFHIYTYAERPFDRYEFSIDAKQTKAVEGHTYYITYWLDEGDGPLPSAIQTIRNHQNAIKKIGGTLVYDDGSYRTVMRVTRQLPPQRVRERSRRPTRLRREPAGAERRALVDRERQ